MHAIADPLDRARQIAAALPEGGLFHEKAWRVSPDPFEIDAGFADELDKLGHRLVRFQQACNILYYQSVRGKLPTWIAELLDRGKPPELIEAARDARFRNDLPQVIRPDVILTETGYTLAELDSVPGGIGLTAWLGEQYAVSGADILGGSDGMLRGFARIFDGGEIIVSEEAATYRPEMEWLAARLTALSADGAGWRVTDGSARTEFAANAYRFFELFDLPNVPCAAALIEQARAGNVRITPPVKPWMEEKLWFALFWLKPLESFWRRELSERVFLALRECIPYTWLVDPTPLPPHAVLPGLDAHSWADVQEFSQKQRDFVLKISGFSETAWGSRGVTIGSDVPQSEWRDAISEALEAWPTHPHILQAFHKGRVLEHTWWNPDTDALEVMKSRVRLCPYYFPDGSRVQCAGALATICPSDKKLLHGMRDAILVPTAVRVD